MPPVYSESEASPKGRAMTGGCLHVLEEKSYDFSLIASKEATPVSHQLKTEAKARS